MKYCNFFLLSIFIGCLSFSFFASAMEEGGEKEPFNQIKQDITKIERGDFYRTRSSCDEVSILSISSLTIGVALGFFINQSLHQYYWQNQ